MGFNLNDYETVKQRKKRFYEDHEDGRIIVELQNIETVNSHAVFKAIIFKNVKDQSDGVPFSTGYAHEQRDTELSVSKKGEEYESVNYSAWVENCEESAVGRALDNAGYAGKDQCSREEMKKVERKTGQPKIDFNVIIEELKNIDSLQAVLVKRDGMLEMYKGMSPKQHDALMNIFQKKITSLGGE